MSVKIIIDSASDISKEFADQNDLAFLPLKTIIDGQEYLDGITISHEEFYQKLATCKEMPTTSQVNPDDFEKVYRKVKADGDEAIAITLSSKLSGTWQSAMIAANGMEDCVHVVDSLNATISEQILVLYAMRLRDEGRNAKYIVDALLEARPRICIVALVDTLEYLVKGGRLSKAAGFAGSMLNIKPVISLDNGVVVMLGKALGSKKSNNLLNQTIQKKGGIDFSMPYLLAYSGQDDSLLQEYIENSRALWEGHTDTLPVATIGSTIGTHAGPGAVAVAFFANPAGS